MAQRCPPFLLALIVILRWDPTSGTSLSERWMKDEFSGENEAASSASYSSSLTDPTRSRRHVFDTRDDRRQLVEQQIVGGTVVTSQLYPFFVQSDATVSGGVCGGSLIAMDFVLTAAHCYKSYNRSAQVLVGPYKRDSIDGPAQYRDRVGNLQVHPNNNETTVQYDFMLFKIQPVTLSNLKPIELNLDGNVPVAGQQLTVIGMGTSDDGNTSNVLEQVTLSAVSNAQCEQEYATSGGRTIDFNSMVCASTTNGKDVCGGDSGGPLFDEKKRQVGLVSFGPSNPCANPIVSGVYARVSGAESWIKQVVCKQSSDPPQYLCKNSNGGGGGGGGGNSTGNGTVPYRIKVQYGAAPRLVEWKLVHPAGGNRSKILARVPMGRVRLPNVRVTKTVKLKAGKKYKLVIKTGSTTRRSTGYVKLYRRSKLIQTIPIGQVDRKKVISFEG